MGVATARLYVATGDSIARLDEKEGVWRVDRSLAGSPVLCLAVDPSDPGTVYIGLGDGGVRRTSDGGRTWVESGLSGEQVFSIAVSAADGAVYAGTEPSALYRSDDRGSTCASSTSSSRDSSRSSTSRRGDGAARCS